MTYSSSIRSASRDGEVIVIGRTDGASAPIYEYVDDEFGSSELILSRYLEDTYQQGLYSTGSIGEVRDMLYAMGRTTQLCLPGDLTLEIPDETDAKAEAEAEAYAVSLPEGAVP